MSFVDNYVLTRSSVFRILVGLFLLVSVANIAAIHQIYNYSEQFHRQQLTRQLNDEILEFGYAALQSHEDIQRLLETKQSTSAPFIYRVVENPAPTNNLQVYPVSGLPIGTARVNLSENYHLEVGFDKQILEEHRQQLIPIVFSGIILPVAIMLIAALLFTVLILKRLEKVNKAMNRVLCGERDVRLEVSRRDDEFDILAIHLNYMITQIRQNESTLKSLTTGLAHDMRTPIARLKLRLEDILSQTDLNSHQYDQFSACHEELELLLSLFNSMLEIARLNSGQLSIETESVDLGQVAKDALEFISPIAEQKQQRLVFRQDQPCIVTGDRSLLFRALFNLIENAVKYTPEKGEVNVVIDHFGAVVADNGVGITDQDKLLVCNPMYRADESRTEIGNGLGLSLVDAVVTQHNAQLVFRDNHPGLRARIYFKPTNKKGQT
ncbi:sensor histidine kinase [Vibrio mexicanus]|uniref:sensor histidine kinase n=1 Tax=Vibrio mexicanus TaxID=1004326 RepID=UPI00063CC8F2|nr:HAMP domain-containing sensor histidine kinase [Vibrio mexicanus]